MISASLMCVQCLLASTTLLLCGESQKGLRWYQSRCVSDVMLLRAALSQCDTLWISGVRWLNSESKRVERLCRL